MEERPLTPDVSVAVEGLLNYHWLSLLETSKERERLGLKYLSLGHRGGPFWSLWFSGVLGVYRLELLGAREASGYDWLAEIKLKYYPTPEEACFAGLSMYEQACRIGAPFRGRPAARKTGDTGCVCHRGADDASSEACFTDLVDGTGAPNPTYQDCLPDDFFFAGGLLLAFRRGEGTRIRWQSQDRWRVRLTSDCSVCGDDGRMLLRRCKGSVDRDYPGFLLTDRVARRFLEGWCRFHGYSARLETRYETAGVEFFSDGETLSSAPAGGVRRIAVEVECRRAGIGKLPELPC